MIGNSNRTLLITFLSLSSLKWPGRTGQLFALQRRRGEAFSSATCWAAGLSARIRRAAGPRAWQPALGAQTGPCAIASPRQVGFFANVYTGLPARRGGRSRSLNPPLGAPFFNARSLCDDGTSTPSAAVTSAAACDRGSRQRCAALELLRRESLHLAHHFVFILYICRPLFSPATERASSRKYTIPDGNVGRSLHCIIYSRLIVSLQNLFPDEGMS